MEAVNWQCCKVTDLLQTCFTHTHTHTAYAHTHTGKQTIACWWHWEVYCQNMCILMGAMFKMPILLLYRWVREGERPCDCLGVDGSVHGGCRRELCKMEKFLIDYQRSSPLRFLLLSCSIWWLDSFKGLWRDEAGVYQDLLPLGVYVCLSVRACVCVWGGRQWVATSIISAPFHWDIPEAHWSLLNCVTLSHTHTPQSVDYMHVNTDRWFTYVPSHTFVHICISALRFLWALWQDQTGSAQIASSPQSTQHPHTPPE